MPPPTHSERITFAYHLHHAGMPMMDVGSTRRCGCFSDRPRYSRRLRRPGKPASHRRMARTLPMTFHIHDLQPIRPDLDRLAYAKEIVRAEATALQQVAERLDD